MPSSVVQPTGSPPAFGNLYVLLWTVLNFVLLFSIIAFIFWFIWFIKKRKTERKQLFNKLDNMISLLEHRKDEKD